MVRHRYNSRRVSLSMICLQYGLDRAKVGAGNLRLALVVSLLYQ